MKKHILYRTGIVAAALSVSACGSNSGSPVAVTPAPTPAPSPTPTPTGSVIDRLGAGFASIFRASATAEPRDPVAGDLVAVNATTDPVDF